MVQHTEKFLTRFNALLIPDQDEFGIMIANYAVDKIAISFETTGHFRSSATDVFLQAGVKNYDRFKTYVNYSGRENAYITSVSKVEKFLIAYEEYLIDFEIRREKLQEK